MSIEQLEEALKDESGLSLFEYTGRLTKKSTVDDFAVLRSNILAFIEKKERGMAGRVSEILIDDKDKRDRLDRYVCAAMTENPDLTGEGNYFPDVHIKRACEVMSAVDKHLEQSK